jgi:hypothetical protein
MARRYAISTNDTNTASTTQMGLTSTAAIRPAIYDLLISSSATPASNVGQYQLKRYTAAGTATALTPQALDPGDPAATATAGSNHSVEPTYTANAIMLQVSVNQQATWRWVSAPDGEIILPSTAANGIGFFTLGTNSAFAIDTTIHYRE